MATPPRPQQRQTPPPIPEYQSTHPAQPLPARPGRPQPDQQPQHPEAEVEEPEEKVIAPEEAMALFRAGHRLKKKGDPPERWFAASRLHNVMVVCSPLTEEIEKQIEQDELVLVAD
jgi:hypothetical protein